MKRTEALYRRLMLLYPKRFRDTYGEEMLRLFRERLARARASGARALLRTTLSSFLDLVWSATLERAATGRRRLERNRRPRPDALPLRLFRSLRLTVRSLSKQPMLVFAVVLTLTLGTGATLALFAIAHAAVLRPLPYPEPDRLVSIVQDDPKFGLVPFGPPYLEGLRARATSFEAIAGFSSSWTLTLSGLEEPHYVAGAYVSDHLLGLIGVRPVVGRGFVASDFRAGARAVALVTRQFWDRHFGLDAPFAERDVRLDNDLFTIVGIVPSSLRLPITTSVVSRQGDPAQVLLPWSFNPFAESRAIPVMNVVARLRDGVTLDAATAELNSVGESLAADFPETSQWEVTSVFLRDLVTRGSRRTVWTLFGAAFFLLLIACANVANLMLSRAAERQTEIAIRMSLGARRRQVATELLGESFLLALAGATGGLFLAWTLLEALPKLGLDGLPPSATIRIDTWVAGFALLLAAMTCVVFGLAPALHASRHALRATRATKAGGRSRAVLVAGEIALALSLLVGAGLLVRSFWNLHRVDPGFRAERVLQVPIGLGDQVYDAAQRRNFVHELLESVAAMPGVTSVGAVNRLPLSGSNVFVGVEVEGRRETDDRQPVVDRRVMSPGYLKTMGIPIIEGRDFGSGDRSDSTRVAIVNETLARRFWPDGALGRRVRLQLRSGPGPWLTVVGVCGDIRHHGLDTPAEPELYVPYAQAPVESAIVVARTTSDPLSIANGVKRRVWALDDSIPLDGIGDVSRIVWESMSEPRFRMLVLNGFAALALLLAAVGIYGVTAYSVSSQTREIGLRMALGAEARSVVGLVVKRGLMATIWGIGLGLTGAVLLSQLLEGLLFGVHPTDSATFFVVALLLLAVSTAASYLPARRAARIDPVEALRLE